jgi:hypothetical protein
VLVLEIGLELLGLWLCLLLPWVHHHHLLHLLRLGEVCINVDVDVRHLLGLSLLRLRLLGRFLFSVLGLLSLLLFCAFVVRVRL